MPVLNDILKWSGMALVIAGALFTSLRIDPLNILLLNAGSLAYMLWALRIREMNLVIVNAVLLAIYAIGLMHGKA